MKKLFVIVCIIIGIVISSNAYSTNNKDSETSDEFKNEQKSLYTKRSSLGNLKMINTIGRKILKANSITKPIKFVYSESNIINASTELNNTITVYKGLIKYCEDEDELAFVIGHEIAHATSKDPAKGLAANVTGVTLAVTAGVLAGASTNSKSVAKSVSKGAYGVSRMGTNKLTSGREKNADLLSIDYVVKAGYNPLASISIMNKIGENYKDFWKDHPSTNRRIVMLYNYIKNNYPEYLEKGYNSMFYEMALEDYIYNEACYKKFSKKEK